jgi:hypothetical protein
MGAHHGRALEVQRQRQRQHKEDCARHNALHPGIRNSAWLPSPAWPPWQHIPLSLERVAQPCHGDQKASGTALPGAEHDQPWAACPQQGPLACRNLETWGLLGDLWVENAHEQASSISVYAPHPRKILSASRTVTGPAERGGLPFPPLLALRELVETLPVHRRARVISLDVLNSRGARPPFSTSPSVADSAAVLCLWAQPIWSFGGARGARS